MNQNEAIYQPAHYTQGEIETIDHIRDMLTGDEFVGYCTGNVLKYLARWRHKGGVEDLKKARQYLVWAIERQEQMDAERLELGDEDIPLPRSDELIR